MKIFLYSEINILCILFLTVFYVKLKTRSYNQTSEKLFLKLLASNIILFALDFLWICVDNKLFYASVLANALINCLYFSLMGIASFMWFIYSENIQQSAFVKTKKRIFLCAVPLIIYVVIAIVTIKTGWLFYIDNNNSYHRGILYFIQPLICCAYICFTSLKALYLLKNTVNYAKKMQYIILSSVVVPTVAAGLIQTVIKDAPILCVGITIGILNIFINMQEQLISVDSLTGLNNRTNMMQRLFEFISHYSNDKQLYLLMLDIDSFKKINDNYGHIEGDNAIIQVADALKLCSKKRNYFISRYGGDEFIVICELDKSESIESVCEEIYNALKITNADSPYVLTVSIGYAKYNTSIKSGEDFIKLADLKMYENKSHKSYKLY